MQPTCAANPDPAVFDAAWKACQSLLPPPPSGAAGNPAGDAGWEKVVPGGDCAVRRRCEEAVSLAKGPEPAARQHPLHLLATADRVEGRSTAAVEKYRESLALNRELGDQRWVTMETMNLAAAERGLGRLDDAEAHLREALTRALGGDGEDLVPVCVLGFAGIAAERGQAQRAGTLVGAIDAWLEGAAQILDPDDAPEFERAIDRGRAADPTEFDRARVAGHSMSISQAAEFALAGTGDG